MAAKLEARRILLSDLRQAVAQALASDRVLEEEESGRLLASLRPRRVTFWVEFAEEGGGCRLLNAWSHRMLVPGAGGVDQGESGSASPHKADRAYVPDSGRWRCRGCAAPMESHPVTVSYMGSVFTVSLLRCPACGQTLVPEGLALGRMAEVERLLEDK